jgi:hypothetical protein
VSGRYADHLAERGADGLPDGLGSEDPSHLVEFLQILTPISIYRLRKLQGSSRYAAK